MRGSLWKFLILLADPCVMGLTSERLTCGRLTSYKEVFAAGILIVLLVVVVEIELRRVGGLLNIADSLHASELRVSNAGESSVFVLVIFNYLRVM